MNKHKIMYCIKKSLKQIIHTHTNDIVEVKECQPEMLYRQIWHIMLLWLGLYQIIRAWSE